MLARYKIYMRQKRPPEDPLPDGACIDITAYRKHLLSPIREMVQEYLKNPTLEAWKECDRKYIKLLKERFASRRQEFDELRDLAIKQDVHIGCYCPTKANPDVYQCHTVLALRFMKEKYPELNVRFPASLAKE